MPSPSSSSSNVQIQYSSHASSSSVTAQNALLAVSTRYLDSDMEMRKFFGSKVVSLINTWEKTLLNKLSISQIDSVQNQPRTSTNGRQSVRAQPTKVKSILAKPTNEWWPASMREGLSCRMLSPDELIEKQIRAGSDEDLQDVERWYTVEYSKKYRSVTKAFLDAVMSGGNFILNCWINKYTF